MLTEEQFRELSTLAWACNGEALCRTPVNRDVRALINSGLAAAQIGDEWTTLVLTPKGLRQLAS